MAVVRVMYLLELRVRLLEKMVTDFIDGVDIFLSLHRDADAATLSKLEVGGWVILYPAKLSFYHAVLCRAQYCHGKLSVHLSVKEYPTQ